MVTLKITKADNLRKKVIGLIGKSSPEPILIKTRFGIHTFGLKFPIDVLILDRENKVQYIKKNLGPNRIFFWKPIYNIVLELTGGTVKKKGIKIGYYIDLIFI